MSVELLERGAAALGNLVEEVAFVGGATIPPPFLLATKLEAYASRGRGDLLASRDWADIVALVDGREELLAEIRRAPGELVEYIGDALRQLLANDRIVDGSRPIRCLQRQVDQAPDI